MEAQISKLVAYVQAALAEDKAQLNRMSQPEGAEVTSSKKSSRKVEPDEQHKDLVCWRGPNPCHIHKGCRSLLRSYPIKSHLAT